LASDAETYVVGLRLRTDAKTRVDNNGNKAEIKERRKSIVTREEGG
jgi:hypothetical protein